MQAEPVRDKDGNPTGEYRYDGAVANKALELLGRHLGMFADKSHAIDIQSSRTVILLPDNGALDDVRGSIQTTAGPTDEIS
jgi:hypothetical protein